MSALLDQATGTIRVKASIKASKLLLSGFGEVFETLPRPLSATKSAKSTMPSSVGLLSAAAAVEQEEEEHVPHGMPMGTLSPVQTSRPRVIGLPKVPQCSSILGES